MNAKLQALKQDFTTKQLVLQNTKIQLKKEFIGLDAIIDKLIDNVRSWLTLNEIQEKPMIVNLWGLTGVGKTALLDRMISLLGQTESYYRFDLGDKSHTNSLRGGIEQLCTFSESYPVIITLDEFQHTRTLEGPLKKEVHKEYNRQVWDLIDSGKISYYDYKEGYYSLYKYYSSLLLLVNRGLKAVNGVINEELALYCEEFKIDHNETEPLTIIPEKHHKAIKALQGDKEHKLTEDIKHLFSKMDETETLSYLNMLLSKGRSFSTKSFHKAIIFVVGNLDEAYGMSGNNSMDIDADSFHNQSLKISIPHIKLALQSRFREEQIARLGNIHIIYPAFSKHNYYEIIASELEKIGVNFKAHTSLKVYFDKSIHELLYAEGVIPAQGIRPLLTSINFYVKGNLSLFLSKALSLEADIDCFKICYSNNKIWCMFIEKDNVVLINDFIHIDTPITDLRTPKADDLQSLTAVHEAGHAILTMCLQGRKPMNIYATSADAFTSGFLEVTTDSKILSVKGIRKLVAVYLGGRIAEKLVFGEGYESVGAQSDIKKATQLLVNAYTKQGFYKTPLMYGSEQNTVQLKNIDEVEKEIEKEVLSCELLATKVLKREMRLLLVMANILKDKRTLNQKEILDLTKYFSKEVISFHEDETKTYYRKKLETQCLENLDYMTDSQQELFEKLSKPTTHPFLDEMAKKFSAFLKLED